MKIMTSRGGFELKGDDWSDWFSVWPRWGFALKVELPSDWHEEQRGTITIMLGFPMILIRFPWPKRYLDDYQCSGPTYGVAIHHDTFWIYHGNSTSTRSASTTFMLPWQWRNCVHEVLNRLGEWEPYVGSWERGKPEDGRVEETHDYTYTLKSGEAQYRKATIFVERRTWTRPWVPWRMTSKCIDVTFDGEVGERTGSWKGGTIGCGYEMLPGETALETLRRMESERKF